MSDRTVNMLTMVAGALYTATIWYYFINPFFAFANLGLPAPATMGDRVLMMWPSTIALLCSLIIGTLLGGVTGTLLEVSFQHRARPRKG